MVTIEYDAVFKKHFRKRILPHKNLYRQFQQRLELFLNDRRHPLLHNHKLVGSLHGTRAFRITGNIRIIYIEITVNHIVFLDVGTHAQVYKGG